MSETPEGGAATSAARELTQLHGQVEAARVMLIRLLQDVVEAESRLDRNQTARLLEANEQLVISALQNRSDAETATQALDEASRSAELDALTQLPGRALLLDRFAHAIAHARRHRTRLALLFLDLDNFKQINDTLGHAVGDEVLKRAAHCFESSVRAEDTVSRHGGDEFVVLLTEVSQASDAALVAEKMSAALGAENRVGEQVLHLTASIGISLYPDDGRDADTLLERADAAMYRAKRHGLGGIVFHRDAPPARTGEALALEALRRPGAHAEPPLPAAGHEKRHAQLREANERLVLAALSAQELQAAAEQAQRRQTEFLAVVAQELRNPLAPIRIAATLLGRVRTDEPLMPRVEAVVAQQLAQVSRLVGELLDLSGVGAGGLSHERPVVEMAEVIDTAVDACRPAMDARQQHFDVDVPACALEVRGDRARLVQILSNLLDNASRYTREGGRIGLLVEVAGDAVVMTVSDDGIGITADAISHVFEPFMQDTQALGFNEVGLGIGLTVVSKLVEAYGGSVVPHSAGSDRGSRFVVTLPLVQASGSAPD